MFLANSGLKEVATTVTLEGGSVEDWDTVTGRVSPAAVIATTPGDVSFNKVCDRLLNIPMRATRRANSSKSAMKRLFCVRSRIA